MHAYVLMTNHTHLLMTPSNSDGISKVMQSFGRHYVQYINRSYQRRGTLWESRHRSSVVDADNYLLACYRYIEMNPVRARMVEHPTVYCWSSYRSNAEGKSNAELTPHQTYLSLGDTREIREENYRGLFLIQVEEKTHSEIRAAANSNMPLGDSKFKAQIELALFRKIGFQARGRPRIESK